jgi:hypothetical protein
VTTARRVLLLAYVLFATGCTTHEARFERDVPPPPSNGAADSRRSTDAASLLIRRYQTRAISLPPESLAALAQAAALVFKTTGAPGMKTTAEQFAATLLGARVPVAGDQGFFSSTSRGQPDLEATTDAGSALIEVFRVTGDRRYLAAAQSAARAVTSRRMGWVVTKEGFAVRSPGTHSLYSIPLTADAALFLKRTARAGGPAASANQAKRAFHFIDLNQAAVGRWYLNVGANTPMTLLPWASTLLALASTRTAEHQGIVGGGAPGLWSEAFTDSGGPRRTPLVDMRGLGVALSLRLFQRFAGARRDADLAYRSIIDDRRADGTVRVARRDDTIAQATYALAFAERALALRRPDGWYRRLI